MTAPDPGLTDLIAAVANWWRESRKWRHCPHQRLRGVYGDQVYTIPGHRRLICRDCGNPLDGPVSLSIERNEATND